jgi:hypothetical protein
MKRFYEAVVKYDRMGEAGTPEKVTELYVLDSVSITDAEATLIADLEPFIQGECDVTSIKLAKYAEFITYNMFLSAKLVGENTIEVNADEEQPNSKYFAVKISFLSIDDKGKEKKTHYHYIVQATSIETANKTVMLFMKDSMCDYQINNIVETKVVDVILLSE